MSSPSGRLNPRQGCAYPGSGQREGQRSTVHAMHDGHTGLQQGQGSGLPRPPGHQDTAAGTNPGHQVSTEGEGGREAPGGLRNWVHILI
jgi:hypothetical protein